MRHALLFFFLVLQCSFAKQAPLFVGDKLGGGRLSLKESFNQDRYVFVSFWATWCVGCIEELKLVSQKLKEKPATPLSILTVNVDLAETASDVKPLLRANGFEFPVILDPKHEIFSKYQAEKSLPYSVLLSPTGEELRSFQGFSEQLFHEIEGLIQTGKKI